jgi:hypothetical protein
MGMTRLKMFMYLHDGKANPKMGTSEFSVGESSQLRCLAPLALRVNLTENKKEELNR